MLMTSRSDVSPFSPYAADRRDQLRSGSQGRDTYATPLSIWETNDKFQVAIDLPGVTADSIDLNYQGGLLWVCGERTFPERDGQMRYNDRWSGPFERAINLPDMIDPATIEANLADGVLVVTLQKKPEAQPHKVKVRAEYST